MKHLICSYFEVQYAPEHSRALWEEVVTWKHSRGRVLPECSRSSLGAFQRALEGGTLVWCSNSSKCSRALRSTEEQPWVFVTFTSFLAVGTLTNLKHCGMHNCVIKVY